MSIAGMTFAERLHIIVTIRMQILGLDATARVSQDESVLFRPDRVLGGSMRMGI